MDDRKIEISRADERDIPRIGALLLQVNNVHAAIRPDLFFRGGRKYTDEALSQLLNDETRPVFAARLRGVLVGYAFLHPPEARWSGRTGKCNALH